MANKSAANNTTTPNGFHWTKRTKLIAAALCVVVLAAICVIIALTHGAQGSQIRLENGQLTGVGENWIVGQLDGGKYVKLGEVMVPDGYHAIEGASANSTSAEPELYYAPDSPDEGVAYIYYTSGAGDYKQLADTAVKAYMAFYDDYKSSAIQEGELAGKSACWFTYTCSYLNESETATVYEQSAICYYPSAYENACTANILCFRYNTADGYKTDAELMKYIELAGNALKLEEVG